MRIGGVSVFKLMLLLFFLSFNSLAEKESEASKYEYLDLFSQVLNLVEKQYYRKVSTEKLMEGAIKGILETLDPHSVYLDQKALEKMKSDTSGKFGGLGIEVTSKDGVIWVISPFEGTPAFRAGIKNGDKIVEIEHESILGIGLEDAVKKMHGRPGTKVNVGIIRRGSEKIERLNLTREIIKVKPVKSELLEKNYAYIRLTQFQTDSSKYIQKHLENLFKKSKEIKGIIFDLRFNPGGLLEEAVKVSSIFLKEGIIVSTEARNPKKKEVRMVLKGGFKDTKTPLVILINGASASASEIVAGALKDHKRAIVMGSQSFGKGSVQTVLELTKKQGLKLTIQQYMTPNGTKIQGKGIEPDIKIPEVKSNWSDQVENEPFYIRERDLRNYISATIETKEEKKIRIRREKQRRIKYQAQMKKQKERKEKGQEESDGLPHRFNPKEDFQVHTAINYLKSFSFYQRFKRKGFLQ